MERELDTKTSMGPLAGEPIDVTDLFKRAVWQDKLANGRDKYDALKNGLQVALGSAMVRLTGNEQFLDYYVDKDDDVPVSLLRLMRELPDLPGLSAVLGLDQDDAPILLDLNERDSAHLLIAGAAAAGKTTLLQALLISLAMRERQANLQLMLVDGSESGASRLALLADLPHAIGPLVKEIPQVAEALGFLVGEMAYRQEQNVKTPALVLAIDEVEPLLREGKQPMMAPLMRLLQGGAAVGIHVILTTGAPDSPILDNVLKVSLPLRLVGRVHDAEEARAAAGVANSMAEYLQGYGDFVAVLGDTLTPFQAAYIGDAACRRTIKDLAGSARGKLLAYPIDPVTGEVVDPGEAAITAEVSEETPVAAVLGQAEDASAADPEAAEEQSTLVELDEDIWLDDMVEDNSVDEDVEDGASATAAEIERPRISPRVLTDIDYHFGDEIAADEASDDENLIAETGEEDEPWVASQDLEYEDDDEFIGNYEDDDEIPFE